MSNSDKKKNILEKIVSDKKIHYFIIIILAVIAIFVCVGGFEKKENAEQVILGSDEYVLDLEKRLSKTLSEVEGAGDVSVIITVESGMETVLATEKTITETNGGKEVVESPIIINGKTVVLKELYPKINGVVIVAEGANNITVMRKIQQATTSLLGVDLGRIEILTMK